METKGRGAPRGAGPIRAPAGPVKPVEIPALAIGATEASTEQPKPAEILAAPTGPAETALNLVETASGSVSEPIIDTLAKAAKNAAPDDRSYFARDALTALAHSQAALACGLEALSAEMAGLSLAGLDTVARTATKMLEVKTLSDAIEINAGFTCSNLDTLVGGSAKLSQLGIRLAAETSQSLLRQFGQGWNKAGRLGS
jgi:Phasin protein